MKQVVFFTLLMLITQPIWAYKMIGMKDSNDAKSVTYVVRCDNKKVIEVKKGDDGSFYKGKHFNDPRTAIRKACNET